MGIASWRVAPQIHGNGTGNAVLMKKIGRVKPKLKFRIRTKMLLAFSGISLVALIFLGYVMLGNISGMCDYALEMTASLGESATNDSTEALEDLGARMIKQKAEDVAVQSAIYMNAHPDMTVVDLQASPEFQEIAVQPVGETGYTALTDYDTLICRFHSNPSLANSDLHDLAQSLPGFWKIMDGSQRGRDSFGYYDWKEPDGSIRKKYMHIMPVNARTKDGVGLSVAATTYVDEFSKPVEETRKRITAETLIVNEYINLEISNIRRTFMGFLVLVILAVFGASFFLSRAITNPIMALAEAAQSVERGQRFEPESVAGLTQTGDELAHLTQVFIEMAVKVQAREEGLKRQVEELRIEIEIKIDEVKKAKQVEEITETEYFKALQRDIAKMREEKRARGK